LKAYYDQHKTNYNILVPQKEDSLRLHRSGQIRSEVQISDKELQDEYNSLKPEFKQAASKSSRSF
jgi:hypothetical protein